MTNKITPGGNGNQPLPHMGLFSYLLTSLGVITLWKCGRLPANEIKSELATVFASPA
ncbi:MAG: hypothetical protein ACXVI9_10670 [Mucilaginibacter sp.]